MVTLSALADEISTDLTEQMDVLQREGIKNIELRGVWGKPVLDLGNAELDKIAFALDEQDFGVSAIASPVGDGLITEDFQQQAEALERTLELAGFFGTEYVRAFSFRIPEGDSPQQHRDEVMRRLDAMADLAEAQGIVLLCENQKGVYGDTGGRCKDIMDTIDSPMLRSLFNLANFVQVGEKPYGDCFGLIGDSIEYVRVNDALLSTGQAVAIGEGDAEAERVLSQLIVQDGFEGFLSVGPRVDTETAGGFQQAARALKQLLERIGAAYL